MTVEMHAENATHVSEHTADSSHEWPPPLRTDAGPTEEPAHVPVAAPEPPAVVARAQEIERRAQPEMEPETAESAEQEPPSEPPEAPADATPEQPGEPDEKSAPDEKPAPDEKKHWY